MTCWQYASLLLILTPDRRQSKKLILSMNKEQKLLETEFLIDICRLAGDKWQSKTLFLAIFDPRLTSVMIIFNCILSSVILKVPMKFD